MYCHDLAVMGSSPDWAELGVGGTSKSYLNQTLIKYAIFVNVFVQCLKTMFHV